jgi:hypothetical protein
MPDKMIMKVIEVIEAKVDACASLGVKLGF